MTLTRKLEARGECIMPPGSYVSQFTALDTHALLIMISMMHWKTVHVKSVCRKAKCHVQTSRSLQSDCHVNATGTLCFMALELHFLYIHWGANAESRWMHWRWRVELGSFHICPGLLLPTACSPCWPVAKGRKVSDKFLENFNRKLRWRIVEIFQIGNFRGVNGNLWEFGVI